MSYRILYLGNDWYGSCARACGFALRRLGHTVLDVSCDRWEPLGKLLPTKVALRLMRPLLTRDFNFAVMESAEHFKPDALITFKGVMVQSQTLRALREQGIRSYQYYPDNSVFCQPRVQPSSMAEYDCCFFSKKFLIADTRAKIDLRDAVYLPHGYDPEIHAIPSIDDEDQARYAADVSIIGTHTAGKERFCDALLRQRESLNLRIWGSGWVERCKSQRVCAKVVGAPLYGQSYAKALRIAKINLALLIEATPGASQGDQTTTRSFEIPACGGFMLHPRTEDVLDLYEEGSEIACFSSPSEAFEKIDYYLSHPAERENIAAAGHKRAVPAYSYDERMKAIIDYHEQKRTSAPLNQSQGAAAI